MPVLRLEKWIYLQAIVKACEGLAAKGEIKEKVYGKQKVYVADQSQFPEVDDSEIKSMDSNIGELTQQVQATMEEVKRLESGKLGDWFSVSSVFCIPANWFDQTILDLSPLVEICIDQSNKVKPWMNKDMFGFVYKMYFVKFGRWSDWLNWVTCMSFN